MWNARQEDYNTMAIRLVWAESVGTALLPFFLIPASRLAESVFKVSSGNLGLCDILRLRPILFARCFFVPQSMLS